MKLNNRESVPEQIYDTAKATAVKVEDLKTKIIKGNTSLFFNNDEDPYESFVDLKGSHKNLIIALGSKAIDYDDTDVESAISIATNSVDLTKANLDEVLLELSNNPYKTFLNGWINHNYPYTMIVGFYTLIVSFVFVFKAFSLNNTLLIIPTVIIISLIFLIAMSNKKIKELENKYNMALNIQYLIESLRNQNFK
jgi:hypothetical protein